MILGAAVLAVAVLVTTAIAAQEEIRQVPIRSGDPYVTSGAWTPSGLLLLNLAENRLERMQANGELAPLRPFDALPGWVRALDEAGDLMVQMRSPDEWWAIRVGASSEWAIKARWGCETCSISHWAPLDAKTVLGVGEVHTGKSDQDWTQGIFWITPDGPELAYPLEEKEMAIYLLGLQWVAVVGDEGFAIVPEPEIEGKPGERYLQIIGLPAFNRSHRVVSRLPIPVPDLTSYQTAQDLPQTMADLSRQRIPMSLVGWRGNLYLIEKDGEKLFLWSVDTQTGGLHFQDTLPASDFVTVIPGDAWAFLRKGPLVSFGKQRIQSVVLFPGSRLGR